jgi:hypothetical protein
MQTSIVVIPESEFESLKKDIAFIKDSILNNNPGGVYDDLITVEQLRAKLGGVDDSTIWRHEKSGRLKPVKIGSKKLYRLSEVLTSSKK